MPAASRMLRPSSSLVPVRRTATGTPGGRAAMALAMWSQRVIPPKMLMKRARTPGLRRAISMAAAIFSVVAPPPTSRKLAGRPPNCATMSRVDMTRPAPFPMMARSPSSST